MSFLHTMVGICQKNCGNVEHIQYKYTYLEPNSICTDSGSFFDAAVVCVCVCVCVSGTMAAQWGCVCCTKLPVLHIAQRDGQICHKK
jgi:hypothetical protein